MGFLFLHVPRPLLAYSMRIFGIEGASPKSHMLARLPCRRRCQQHSLPSGAVQPPGQRLTWRPVPRGPAPPRAPGAPRRAGEGLRRGVGGVGAGARRRCGPRPPGSPAAAGVAPAHLGGCSNSELSQRSCTCLLRFFSPRIVRGCPNFAVFPGLSTSACGGRGTPGCALHPRPPPTGAPARERDRRSANRTTGGPVRQLDRPRVPRRRGRRRGGRVRVERPRRRQGRRQEGHQFPRPPRPPTGQPEVRFDRLRLG